jgi:two-component system, NarL family, response regulator DevR
MGSKKAPPIAVLIVDDHRTFAEALAIAIRLEKGFATHVAAGYAEGVEMAARDQPDVALVDLEMPSPGGVETIRRLREAHPAIKVIVLSAHADDLSRARAVEAGAAGYLSKDEPVQAVADALRRTRLGEPLIERDETLRLLRHLRHRRHQESTERQRAGRLTSRQREILELLSDGKQPREVAEELGMSWATFRTHMQNILTRLGAHSKLEAVTIALRQGKISGSRW